MECKRCNEHCIKRGLQSNGTQRYYCKVCKLSQQKQYTNRAYKAETDTVLIAYLKEGLGIRSMSRLLEISVNTVISRIIKWQLISKKIKDFAVESKGEYAVGRLKEIVRYRLPKAKNF